uniref:Uncharacterized protein n=1 Tax=Heliothis virescens TaxID=7102 RepID=A0A2A4J3G8_HELVI
MSGFKTESGRGSLASPPALALRRWVGMPRESQPAALLPSRRKAQLALAFHGLRERVCAHVRHALKRFPKTFSPIWECGESQRLSRDPSGPGRVFFALRQSEYAPIHLALRTGDSSADGAAHPAGRSSLVGKVCPLAIGNRDWITPPIQ